MPLLRHLSRTTTIVWVPQTAITADPPSYQTLRGFSNVNFRLYNKAIEDALESRNDSPLVYWHSAWQTSVDLDDFADDGMHFGRFLKKHLAQILINWMCYVAKDDRTHVFDYRKLSFAIYRNEPCCA